MMKENAIKMEFGRYPQWLAKAEECEKNGDYYTVGINDAAFIYDNRFGEEYKSRYIDWEQHKDDIYFFVSTPIVWRVLKETEEKLFLLSEYNIECKQFHEKNDSVIWEQSSLRKWLNGDFLRTAFNEEERECILETEVPNEGNPISFSEGQWIKGGPSTMDKIFLLSYRDVMNVEYGFDGYITQSETREAKNTDWTRVMGALTNPEKENGGWWWLRNPGRSHQRNGRIDVYGTVYFQGEPITEFAGVRPAMYLDKKKITCEQKGNH